jgi:ribulose-phosphate 3-epimerase
VQVDGGVGRSNVEALRSAGANLLVAGTAVFGGENPATAYRDLVRAVT